MSMRLAILGSTGSIGTQTIDVVQRNSEHFQISVLVANTNVDTVVKQALALRPKLVVLANRESAELAREALPTSIEVASGEEAICESVARDDVDAVVAAIVGFAGLRPVLAAIGAGKDLALANKEALVTAGPLVMESVRSNNIELVPVDSEHGALYQCLMNQRPRQDIDRLVITATGGPFLDYTSQQLDSVTPELAVKHPRWNMGAKISVDSSTLMNKGLEVIEAAHLFDIPVERLGVVVHPEALVHGLVEYSDDTMVAVLFETDMRIPIAFALKTLLKKQNPSGGIGRLKKATSMVDLAKKASLTFREPDVEKFPALSLAFTALREGGLMPTVLNAANEIAVESFLAGVTTFKGIPRLVEEAMQKVENDSVDSIESIFECDRVSREIARNLICS